MYFCLFCFWGLFEAVKNNTKGFVNILFIPCTFHGFGEIFFNVLALVCFGVFLRERNIFVFLYWNIFSTFSLSFKNLGAMTFLLQSIIIWLWQVANKIFLPILLNVEIAFYAKQKAVARLWSFHGLQCIEIVESVLAFMFFKRLDNEKYSLIFLHD